MAIVNIRSLLTEELMSGKLNLRGRIEVADGSGATVLTVPFKDAVAITMEKAP